MNKRKNKKCVICEKLTTGKKCIDCFSNKHIHQCQNCGKKMIFKNNNPKRYCNACEQKIMFMKHKAKFTIYEKNALGTVDISPHMSIDNDGNPDWDREKRVINSVKKKLYYWGNCIKFHRGFGDAHGYDWYNNLVY